IGSPQPHCLFAPSPAPFLTVESPIRKSVGGFAFALAPCAEAVMQNTASNPQIKSRQVATSILFGEGIRQSQKSRATCPVCLVFSKDVSDGSRQTRQFALLSLTIGVIGPLPQDGVFRMIPHFDFDAPQLPVALCVCRVIGEDVAALDTRENPVVDS